MDTNFKSMIRYLSSADAEAFLQIREDSLRTNPESFGGSPNEMNLEEARRALDLDNKKNFVLGYFDNRRLMGIIGFVRKNTPKCRHNGFIWGFLFIRKFDLLESGDSYLKHVSTKSRQWKG